MSEPLGIRQPGGEISQGRHGYSLADILERILDKGIVIAGDIRVDLLDIELLTIRIRLLISSADKAAELGMAWWRQDPYFTGESLPHPQHNGEGTGEDPPNVLQQLLDGTDQLRRRVDQLERDGSEASPQASPPAGMDDDGGG